MSYLEKDTVNNRLAIIIDFKIMHTKKYLYAFHK